jgi:hypothetical protein
MFCSHIHKGNANLSRDSHVFVIKRELAHVYDARLHTLCCTRCMYGRIIGSLQPMLYFLSKKFPAIFIS